MKTVMFNLANNEVWLVPRGERDTHNLFDAVRERDKLIFTWHRIVGKIIQINRDEKLKAIRYKEVIKSWKRLIKFQLSELRFERYLENKPVKLRKRKRYSNKIKIKDKYRDYMYVL